MPVVVAYAVVVIALAVAMPRWAWRDEPRRQGTLRVLGAGVLGAAMVVPLALYEFAVTVNAGLCGHMGWREDAAAALAFAVVLSWGLRSRRRILYAFPGAVLAAAGCALLAAYADGGAHGYCETLIPYVVSV